MPPTGYAGEEDPRALAQELIRDLASLTDSQIKILASVARALRVPVKIARAPISDLVNDNFAERMANLLTLHHSIHEEPLSKKSFEYMFKQCLMARGVRAVLNSAPGDTAWDVAGGDILWSLKTEAAIGISRTQVKVEKLMEARWVRECTTPESCAQQLLIRVPKHMSDYDRILVLRAFRISGGVEYALEEIPKDLLLDSFAEAKPGMFSKRGRALSFGADFHDPRSGTRVFRVLLDSSVEKIRLWYSQDHCQHHGTWTVPVERTLGAQQSVNDS